jgi:hypothetical protein
MVQRFFQRSSLLRRSTPIQQRFRRDNTNDDDKANINGGGGHFANKTIANNHSIVRCFPLPSSSTNANANSSPASSPGSSSESSLPPAMPRLLQCRERTKSTYENVF